MMNSSLSMRKWSGVCGGIAGVLMFGAIAGEAAHVILNDGRRIEGSAIRARANGDIILTTQRGPLEFVRNQYREAWADRPADLDRARQAMQAGQYDRVLAPLEAVVTEYRHLSWDLEALAMIGAANTAKGDYSAALSAYDRLFQSAPNRRDDENIRWDYYAALLGAEQYSRLEPMLSELIRTADRSQAGRAQMMRGDLRVQQGQTEEGLLDYLRTAVLFKSEAALQPEAHFKAGLALEQMRDQRARDMFRKVIENYANSPYAQQARGKL